jgi:hypothetical protein
MSLTHYPIKYPAISSGTVFNFETDSGLDYEVRFARKKDNLLHTTIAFGVLNDEYEGEEYSLTNKGETYRVMATIVEIFKYYIDQHPNVHTYEFVGEPRADENSEFPTKRLNLYGRYLPKIFDKSWKIEVTGNKVIISKI